MIVSTYLENGKFGGFRDIDNIPDGFFIAEADYPQNLIDGYYDVNLKKWHENASEELIRSLTVPLELSRMKFKMQIRRSTIYSYDIILEYLKNLAINETFTQDDKDELIDRLEDAVSFNRYHKDFINLANMLGVSDEIKDEIFINGNLIE